MIIRRMKASFGKLKNSELVLEEGLNIINLPNEAGKSTWCAFIRAMLYGINTAERDRAGFLSDKTRYRPWGEYPMEGAMDIVWKGREITLTRKSRGSGLMGHCEAFYTGTSEPCAELSGKSPGEILIGVPEQVFRRSAFISRPAMALDKDTELEKRISSLVTSGEEDTSYTEASERLAKWLRKRNRKSLAGAAEKLQMFEERLERLEEESGKLSDLRLEKKRLTEEQKALNMCIAMHKQKEQSSLAERCRLKRMEQEELEAELEAVTAALSPSGKIVTREDIDITKSAFDEQSSAEALAEQSKRVMEEASEELNNAKRTPDPGARKPKYIAYLSSAGMILIILNWFSTVTYLWAIGAVFIAAAFLLLFWELKRTNKSAAEVNADRNMLESKYYIAQERYTQAYNILKQAQKKACAHLKRLDPGAKPENAPEVIKNFEAGIYQMEQLKLKYEAVREIADEMEKLCPDTDIKAPVAEPEIPRQEAEIRLADISNRLETVSDKLSMAQGEIMHLGDPLVIGSGIESLKQEIERLNAECEALELASRILYDSDVELHNRFSPVVSKRAGELMSRLSGGRYTGVLFDKSMRFKACAENEAVQRDAEYLSDGTIDQLYLAARLAVTELVLDNEEPCPIILDDVLANFDDGRAQNALELLREAALDRQVIFFTCRDREVI